MELIDRIDKILIMEAKLPQPTVKKIIAYLDKKYPDADVGVAFWDGKMWFRFDYENGGQYDKYMEEDFEELGLGPELDWKSTEDKDAAKAARVKKVYIMDL